ncbi:MAG TPA: PspA/IM30 family protein [Polyangiaceae bacterium]
MDDPETILTRLIAVMTERLIERKNDVALARREERRLARQVDVAQRTGGEWEQRAMAAVRAGDDFVARDALVRKREQDRTTDELRNAYQKQLAQVEGLTNTLEAFNRRIEQAKHKRNSLIIRAKRTRAEQVIRRIVEDAPAGEPFEILDRIEAKISRLEDEHGLVPELSDEAIASSAARADDAPLVDADLVLIKKTISEPEPVAPKPLAKTSAGQGVKNGPKPRSSAGASGQRRTKR